MHSVGEVESADPDEDTAKRVDLVMQRKSDVERRSFWKSAAAVMSIYVEQSTQEVKRVWRKRASWADTRQLTRDRAGLGHQVTDAFVYGGSTR